MLPFIIGAIFILAAFSGALSGNMEAVAAQSAGAAADAVKNIITMAGGICFWSGIMEIMGECGLSERLTGLLRRPIALIYGNTCRAGSRRKVGAALPQRSYWPKAHGDPRRAQYRFDPADTVNGGVDKGGVGLGTALWDTPAGMVRFGMLFCGGIGGIAAAYRR